MMFLIMAIGAASMPGCSGCRPDPDERLKDKIEKEKERQKKKKPKPNFRSPGTAILPGKYPDLEGKTPDELKEMTEQERAIYFRNQFSRVNRTKLGHWLETSTPTIANNFNQEGQINSLPMSSVGPAKVTGTNFEIATARSFSLVKGQWKYLPSTVYLPMNERARGANMRVDLSTSNNSLPFYSVPLAASQTMRGFQHHMVMLSNRPEQIRYLQFTDSVQIRQSQYSTVDTLPFYHVVTNAPGKPIPLPRNVLNWTTTAYLIWDDVEPDDLDPDQQQALVDWLHFGGQLILSGPDCLSKLETSFLADYLPAQSEGKTKLDAAAFEPINENWSVPNRSNPSETRSVLVTDVNPVIGIEFKPHTAANFVAGTGELTIERMIGRGRVVATAFSLTSPTIKSWGSFPSYLNNALLRKPRRRFGLDNDNVFFDWAEDATIMYDALLGSTLRFISRDLANGGTPPEPENETDLAWDVEQAVGYGMPGGARGRLSDHANTKRNKNDARHYGGFASDLTSGTGGWSDESAISRAARSGLKSAAGISPPSADLILKMLGVYLLILVPLNWLIFRAIGKVEWAWAAVPLIAIAGAVTVVKIASLDIGFARSNTQVALLEIHDDYHRGHLSQYSALYTSLSTNYAIELDNATGIALPLGLSQKKKRASASPQRLTLQQSLINRTENLQIQSNSTGLLHAEWMQDVGGKFRLVSDQQQPNFKTLKLKNTTTVNLSSAGIIARDAKGKYYSGWIGNLDVGDDTIEVSMNAIQRTDLPHQWAGTEGLISMLASPQQLLSRFELEDGGGISLEQIKALPLLEPYWDTFETLAELTPETDAKTVSRGQFLSVIGQAKLRETGSLVGNLLSVILDNLELGRGEIRLLGISDQQIGETRFVPESTQSTTQTLEVAHLRQPDLPLAQPDLNSVLDFSKPETSFDDEFSDEIFDSSIEEE